MALRDRRRRLSERGIDPSAAAEFGDPLWVPGAAVGRPVVPALPQIPSTVNYIKVRDPEQRRRMAFARNEWRTFLQRYFPNDLVKPFHERIYETLWSGGRWVINVPTDHGKLCADSEPIWTTQGLKTHGELEVGDFVFGLDGTPTPVIAISEPGQASVRVTMTDGTSVVVHPRHEWTVFDRRCHRMRTLETRQLVEEGMWTGTNRFGKPRARFILPRRGALQMPQGLLERKQTLATDHHRRVGIKAVTPCEPESGRCIQVLASDGIYLVGEALNPTHNSTICNVRWPILSLAEDPNGAHIGGFVNEKEGKRWISALKAELKYNHALIKDYPWLKQPARDSGKAWEATQITIDGREDYSNSNPSFVVRGYTADDLKGRRGRFTGDDLEGKGSVRATEREELYEIIQLHLARIIEDEAFGHTRPLVALCGTPFDNASIYFRLHEDHDWKVYRQPYKYPLTESQRLRVLDIGNDPDDPDLGSLIFPEKQEKIRQLRNALDERQFSIAMRLDPTAGDPTALTSGRVRTMLEMENPLIAAREHYGFCFVDPAAGSKNRGVDYAGIGIARVRWEEGESWPLVEVSRLHAHRGRILQQVHDAARLAIEEEVPIVLETNGSQWENYSSLFEHFYGTRVKLLRHHTSEEKKYDAEAGMSMIADLVQQGRLKVADDPDSEGAKRFRHEVVALGTGAHDHICAGIWFCVRYVFERHRHRRVGGRVGVARQGLRYGGGNRFGPMTRVLRINRRSAEAVQAAEGGAEPAPRPLSPWQIAEMEHERMARRSFAGR